MATCGEDGDVCLWDEDGSGLARLHVSDVTTPLMVASPDGRTLYVGDDSGVVRRILVAPPVR